MPNSGIPYEILAARTSSGVAAVAVDSNFEEAIAERKGLLWIHVTANEIEASTQLLQSFGFHPLAVEDALSDSERPALHHYDQSIFLAANVVRTDGDAETYHEVGIFVGSTFVVTVTRERCTCLQETFRRWSIAPHTVGRNPGFLLHAILDSIVDEYFPASDKLEDDIDDLETGVYKEGREAIDEILQIKKRLMRMRRHTIDLRDALNSLLRGDGALVGNDTRPYFQDVYDHALRIAENLDLNRDILATILDTQLSIISNNLNLVMKKMTAYATMLMSASLIAGIYGMNFKYMPELGLPWGYAGAWILMAVVSIGLFIRFKRIGWL